MTKPTDMTPKRNNKKLENHSPQKIRQNEERSVLKPMQNTLNLERRQTTSTTDSFPEFLGSSVSKEEIETLENKIYVLE